MHSVGTEIIHRQSNASSSSAFNDSSFTMTSNLFCESTPTSPMNMFMQQRKVLPTACRSPQLRRTASRVSNFDSTRQTISSFDTNAISSPRHAVHIADSSLLHGHLQEATEIAKPVSFATASTTKHRERVSNFAHIELYPAPTPMASTEHVA